MNDDFGSLWVCGARAIPTHGARSRCDSPSESGAPEGREHSIGAAKPEALSLLRQSAGIGRAS
jgi:hypothetical protein